MVKTYKIVRHYRDMDRKAEVIDTGLTLEEAQAHCRRADTSCDEFFDGYDRDNLTEAEKAERRAQDARMHKAVMQLLDLGA